MMNTQKTRLEIFRHSICLGIGLLLCAASYSALAANTGCMAGLDHMPLAVANLQTATATYQALGFSIKPGRPHPNGIENNNIKFRDGAGIELITAPAGVDALTTTYRQLLKTAEGPAFFALHVRDTAKLIKALQQNAIPHRGTGSLIELNAPALNFLFLVEDNRSPTDRPAHFAHRNGASAMIRVWLAMHDDHELRRLLTAFGCTTRTQTVNVPDAVQATVVSVENGEIVLLPESRQVTKGRPIVGATFQVRDLQAMLAALKKNNFHVTENTMPENRKSIFIHPRESHGIWLEFQE